MLPIFLKPSPFETWMKQHCCPVDWSDVALNLVAKERLKLKGLRPPIGNPPWIQSLWTDYSYRVKIKEKNQAIKDAATIAGTNILRLYTDASVAQRLAAIAVVRRTGIAT
jgi:hypothetical protein